MKERKPTRLKAHKNTECDIRLSKLRGRGGKTEQGVERGVGKIL